MLAICTGISGTDKWAYLLDLADYAGRRHKALQVLDLGNLVEQEARRLFKQSHIAISASGTDKKVLDLPRSTARQLAATASEQVLGKIRHTRGNYLVSTHASFRWVKSMMLTADTHYIDEWKPDCFLTVTDVPSHIRATLQQDPKWKDKSDVEEIAAWQQEEIEATRLLAGYRRKPWKAFPRSSSTKEIFDYLFKRRRRSIKLPVQTQRRPPNKTVYCTSISGSKAREYLTAFCDWAGRAKDHNITLLDLGAKVVQVAQRHKSSVNRKNILHESAEDLNYWRQEAIGQIRNERRECGDCIILGHTCFRRHFDEGDLLLGFDPEQELTRWSLINPETYVTIMDNILSTRIRLQREDFAEGLKLDLREISMWRDEERFFTRLIAENFRKPHYILPLAEPFDTLYGIAFDRGRKKTYLSFPITEVNKKSAEERTDIFTRKNRLRDNLRDAYVVFDPLSILDGELIKLLNSETRFPTELSKHLIVFEGDRPMKSKDLSISRDSNGRLIVNYGDGVVLSAQELEEVRQHIVDQIVERDYYLIDQSDWVTVYYPVPDVSPGVISEVIYGFSHGRDVFVWWYSPQVSPFLETYATEICHSEEELRTELQAQARK
jgi:adenylate kinase